MYSIILPCYNERDNLRLLISKIQKILKNINFEIIIIDDNSEDGTEKMITESFSKMQNLMFVKRENKIKSLGKSVLEGMLKTKNNYIIVMDSDFNHDPNDLLKIIEIQTKHHYDLICCSRFLDKKSNDFVLRYKLSEYYNLLIKPFLNSKIKDNLSGFFLINKELLSNLKLNKIFYGYGDYYFRLLFYLQKKTNKIYEMGIVYNERKYGKSKTRFLKTFFQYTYQVIKLKFDHEKN